MTKFGRQHKSVALVRALLALDFMGHCINWDGGALSTTETNRNMCSLRYIVENSPKGD